MSSDSIELPDLPEDERLTAAMEEYYRRRALGPVVPQEFAAEFPEVAAELLDYLAAVEEIHQLAPTQGSTSSSVNSETPLERIRYFGDYELLSEIARGGMGVVYRARQVSLGRLVAVKMILSGRLASEEDVARFHQEAAAAARLQHPNIVTIYETGEHEGQHFFSMEYVEGGNLAQLVRESPLGGKLAAEYARTIAEAIGAIHGAGLLHRDLKPSNVLIQAKTGILRVTDFGLAKSTDTATLFTSTGQVMGTPSYMAPEQAVGEHSRVGPHSDIYSIGAILYELMTGRPPFLAETPWETAWQVSNLDVVAPTSLNPKIPRDLETICLKCLQKDSSRRYATAQDLADDLGRFLRGEPIHARPVGRLERAWGRCGRNLLAAAVLLIALAAGATAYAAEQRRLFQEQKELAEQRAEFGREQAEAAEELRQERDANLAGLYEALVGRARALRQAREPGYRKAVWDCLRQAAAIETPAQDPEQLRGIALSCLGDFMGLGQQLAAGAERVERPVITEEAQRVFSEIRKSLPGLRLRAANSEGSLFAVVIEDRQIALYNRDGESVTPPQPIPLGVIHDLVFSADGRLLAAGCEEGSVLWSTPDLKLQTFFRGGVTRYVAIDPDAKWLATSVGTIVHGMELWSLASNRRAAGLPAPGGLSSLTFTADGQLLLACRGPEVLAAWPVLDTPEKRFLSGHRGAVPGVEFSPAGNTLGSVSKDGTLRLWNLSAEVAEPPLVCRGHERDVQSLAFKVDGSLVATGDWSGLIVLWDPLTGENLGSVQAAGQIWRLRFDSAGTRLFSAGPGGLQQWNVTDRALSAPAEPNVPLVRQRMLDLAIHPGQESAAALMFTGAAIHSIPLTGEPVETHLLTGPVKFLPLQIQFTSTGEYLAYGSKEHQLAFWDWSKQELAKATRGREFYGPWALSYDDRWAVHTRGGTAVYDLQADRPLLTLPPEGGEIYCLAWHPAGTQFAIGLADGGVVVWDLEQIRAELDYLGLGFPYTTITEDEPAP